MRPRLTQNNAGDAPLPDTVLSSERLLHHTGCVGVSDGSDSFGGEFRLGVLFSGECWWKRATDVRLRVRPRPVALLADHVDDVVLLCPEEQMVWTDAAPVVAAVAHVQAVGDRAIGFNPREAMCAIADLVPSYETVALAIEAASPPPARRCLHDALPEPFVACHRRSVAQRNAAEFGVRRTA